MLLSLLLLLLLFPILISFLIGERLLDFPTRLESDKFDARKLEE